MDTSPSRSQRTYDHRLRDLVRTAGDPDVVAELGVPRSTALGWLRGEYAPVVTAEVLDMDATRLQAEVCKLRRRVRMLAAIVRLLIALVRTFDIRLDRLGYRNRPRRPGCYGPSSAPEARSRFAVRYAVCTCRRRATETRAGLSRAVSSTTSRVARGRRRRD